MHRSITFLVPMLAIVLVLVAIVPAAARGPMALGVASERSNDMAAVDQFTNLTGAKPRLWTLWSTWGDRGGNAKCIKGVRSCAFPMAAASGLKWRGITPIIWWQPTGPGNEAAGLYGRHKRIINGKHDAYIRQWAKAAKRFGKPVIVRFAHEMNGNWFEWGIKRFNNSPTTFKSAWRHIVKQFRKVGARNVKFLWSPYKQVCGGGCAPVRYSSYYPGNAYVDYVGLTVLNWGAEKGWKSMVRLLETPMRSLRKTTQTRRRPLGKPVILPEVGSNHHPGNKAWWIRSGYMSSYKKWPNLKAIVYFDYDTTFAQQPDWRLATPDGSAIKAYRSVATRKIFSAAIK